eukprot:TRINITY_DN1203_c0_g1_i1.p1 TRINITY_DN1203_c0_g1~~TRINITY_DN1203_c0_g1_i1.p1  ORF type:complete len:382 (-),score=91.00 TRINITY_DN1203_c0_g1_i1:424-1569(-)
MVEGLSFVSLENVSASEFSHFVQSSTHHAPRRPWDDFMSVDGSQYAESRGTASHDAMSEDQDEMGESSMDLLARTPPKPPSKKHRRSTPVSSAKTKKQDTDSNEERDLVWRQMMSDGRGAQAPSLFHIHHFLSLCETPAHVDMSFIGLQRMKSLGIATTTETMSLFVKACCRVGEPSKALDAFMDPRKHHVGIPSLKGLHYLMINFAIRGDLESMFRSVESAQSCGLKPNSRTYHISIRACVDRGFIRESVDLLNRALSENLTIERGTFNVVMNGCRVHSMPDDVLQIYDRFVASQLPENVSTLALVAEAHMLKDNLEGTIEILARLVEHFDIPDDLGERVVSFLEKSDQKRVKSLGRTIVESAKRGRVELPISLRVLLCA